MSLPLQKGELYMAIIYLTHVNRKESSQVFYKCSIIEIDT